MCQITFIQLEEHIVDLNNQKLIPEKVLAKFWKIKQEKGSLPMGISHIPDNGWFIFSPSILENEGILNHIPIDKL